MEELKAVDPGSYVFPLPIRAEGQDSVPGQVKLTIRDFVRRTDALLVLLNSTADALVAEWDLWSEGVGLMPGWNGGGFEPTIQ